jgi:hypothetical protein
LWGSRETEFVKENIFNVAGSIFKVVVASHQARIMESKQSNQERGLCYIVIFAFYNASVIDHRSRYDLNTNNSKYGMVINGHVA